MKKTLMALSLAMCATLALAQTPIKKLDRSVKVEKQISLSDIQSAPVDYKASIFSKDGTIDTLHTYDFSTMDASRYGSSCVLSATDIIQDTAAGTSAHTINSAYTYWKHFTDTASFLTRIVNELPAIAAGDWAFLGTNIAEVMGPAYNGSNNGFMALSMMDYTTPNGNYNTYFTLPPYTNTDASNNVVTANDVIDIRLTQLHRKFYENCFIDYKIGNNWYAREINVEGIDVNVNQWSATRVQFTMPIALADQPTIELRIRVYTTRFSNDPNFVRAAFGYCWAVDNVAIVRRSETERWRITDAQTIDGFYGTIPAGMEIPITYGMTAYNLTRNNISNTAVSVSASTTRDGAYTTVASSPAVTFNGNNVDTAYNFIIDERGFYQPAEGMWSAPAYSQYYGATSMPSTFGLNGLPTDNTGTNYFAVTLSGGNLTTGYDTVLYTVSDVDNSGSYVWAYDNGLIPSGSIFAPQYTNDGYIPNDWETEGDAHHTMRGYQMHLRYTTGSDIPDNWRLLGLEIIPSTRLTEAQLAGVQIVPFIFKEFPEDDFFSWDTVTTGIDDLVFNLNGSEANELTTGYILPGESYNSIRFEFPEQPVLRPNTSYRFGYVLNQAGIFAPAGTETYYRPTDSTRRSYANEPALAEYASQITPSNPYECLVRDYQAARWLYSNVHFSSYPMIRPLVGPYVDRGSNEIVLNCDTNVSRVEYKIGDTSRTTPSVCDYVLPVAADSYRTIYVLPKGDHSVITSIMLNGQELDLTGADDSAPVQVRGIAYNVESSNGDILLARNFYEIFIGPIQPSTDMQYVISVTSENREHQVGIDPFAPEAQLTLTPNPATSSVKLSLDGVSGMVNTSIIDMSGRVVYSANMDAENSNVINLSSIPAGAYFVRVTNDSFSKIEKLIIK